MKAVDKLLKTAKAEKGYLEKASNKSLDDKIANAGRGNYTKYARDLYPALQGQPWCDMYNDWCFVQAFGRIDAERLLGAAFRHIPLHPPSITRIEVSITRTIRSLGIKYSSATQSGSTTPELSQMLP